MYVSSVFIMDTNMKNLVLSDRHYVFFVFLHVHVHLRRVLWKLSQNNEKYNIVQVQFPCDI